MGEAVYSILAVFPKSITAEQQKAIKDFFLEGNKAENYRDDNCGHKTPKEFWQEFKTQFPTVYEYLDSMGMAGKDHRKVLSGKLAFGTPDYIEDYLRFDGREMTYSAEVWHFAEWEGIVNFLKTKFGAAEADYMSEENAPSGTDLMKLMIDAQQAEVVNALLKQDKKFLMTLIGIHPKLDARLEPILRDDKSKGVA